MRPVLSGLRKTIQVQGNMQKNILHEVRLRMETTERWLPQQMQHTFPPGTHFRHRHRICMSIQFNSLLIAHHVFEGVP